MACHSTDRMIGSHGASAVGRWLPYATGLIGFTAIVMLGVIVLAYPATRDPRGASFPRVIATFAALPVAYLSAYAVLTARRLRSGIVTAMLIAGVWVYSVLATLLTLPFVLFISPPFGLASGVIGSAVLLSGWQNLDRGPGAPSVRAHLSLLASVVVAVVLQAQVAVPRDEMSWLRLATVGVLLTAGFSIHAALCWQSLSLDPSMRVSWRRVRCLLLLAWMLPAGLMLPRHGTAALVWPVFAASAQ